jgi:hypothetical protein
MSALINEGTGVSNGVVFMKSDTSTTTDAGFTYDPSLNILSLYSLISTDTIRCEYLNHSGSEKYFVVTTSTGALDTGWLAPMKRGLIDALIDPEAGYWTR